MEERREYRIGLGRNIDHRNARLVCSVVEEIERYVFRTATKGFDLRRNSRRQTPEDIKIFGWNPYFVPNTEQNLRLSHFVKKPAAYISIDAVKRRGKMIIVLQVIRERREYIRFEWRYRIIQSEGHKNLHFEKELSYVKTKVPGL